MSNNGPQYTSEAFARFAKAWDFEHVSRSPGNSQANGKAGSVVKTAKRILTKTRKAGSDLYCAIRPSQHAKARTKYKSLLTPYESLNAALLPTSANLLQPRIVDDKAKMRKKVDKQAEYFKNLQRNCNRWKETRSEWSHLFAEQKLGRRQSSRNVLMNDLI